MRAGIGGVSSSFSSQLPTLTVTVDLGLSDDINYSKELSQSIAIRVMEGDVNIFLLKLPVVTFKFVSEHSAFWLLHLLITLKHSPTLLVQ